MNREIKFRARNLRKGWKNRDGTDCEPIMEYDGFVIYPDGETEFPEGGWDLKGTHDELILMQYTGLKDKNGKEIYEGDVVKWDDASKGKRWRFAEVVSEPGHFTFYTIPQLCINCFKIERVKFRMGQFVYCPDTNSMGNIMEVVGNIYENPELLSN